MRLAIVTHNVMRGDGQSRVAFEIAQQAIRRGHAVTLVADKADPELIQIGAALERAHPSASKPHLIKGLLFAQKADRALSRIRQKFDAILGFGFTLVTPHTINNCQFVHRSWLNSPSHTCRVRKDLYGKYQYLYSRANARWEQFAFDNARFVVASSTLIRDQLISSGVRQDKIRTIFNGVDLKEYHPGDGSRNGLQLPPNSSVGLFVGDLRTPRKNLDSVLRAFAAVRTAHLVVVGDTTCSPYPELASDLGLESRVHFLGFRADVSQVMRSCDFFVFPSRYEACSLVLLEAAASGLPIITARTAGGSEIFTPEAGVVIDDPENIAALTDAICLFTRERTLMRKLGGAARAVAEAYPWTRTADEHLDLLEQHSTPQMICQ